MAKSSRAQPSNDDYDKNHTHKPHEINGRSQIRTQTPNDCERVATSISNQIEINSHLVRRCANPAVVQSSIYASTFILVNFIKREILRAAHAKERRRNNKRNPIKQIAANYFDNLLSGITHTSTCICLADRNDAFTSVHLCLYSLMQRTRESYEIP